MVSVSYDPRMESVYNAFKEVQYIRSVISAIEFHIESIKEEKSKTTISIHIECLEELIPQVPTFESSNVKNMIRDGEIEFLGISEKCKKMKLV